jgi:hypothetical protein
MLPAPRITSMAVSSATTTSNESTSRPTGGQHRMNLQEKGIHATTWPPPRAAGRKALACRVVSRQVRIRRRNIKRPQHRDDLPAMIGRVVDRMKHNLPPGNTETRVVRQDSQEFQCKVRLRSSIDPSSIPIPQSWPQLNNLLKGMLRSRTARQLLVINFRQSAKPDSLRIINMAKGLQNARMRRSHPSFPLLRGKSRTSIENLLSPPGRVAGMREQKLLKLRHIRDSNPANPRPRPATG